MANDILQEYIFKLDDQKMYGIQLLLDNGWLPNHTVFTYQGTSHFRVPEFLTYDEAEIQFKNAEDIYQAPAVRLVRYSRYLVGAKPIPIEILKYKRL